MNAQNIVISDNKEIANEFGLNFCNIASNQSFPDETVIKKTNEENSVKLLIDMASNNNIFNLAEYNEDFNIEELEFALKKQSSTFSGIDKITYQMIYNMNKENKKKML